MSLWTCLDHGGGKVTGPNPCCSKAQLVMSQGDPLPSLRAPTKLVLDWKIPPTVEELREALKPFGVLVYSDPSCAGTDAYGVIFSVTPLTKKDLDDIGYEEEEEDSE